jgi:hypothetical protein
VQDSRSTTPPISCGEGMMDEDRMESCDPSPEHEPEPQLDGPNENACFTPPINFFILHSVTPHVSKPHDYVNHMFMRL